MSLSEHERHELDDIERWLSDDDPALAHQLTDPLARRRWGLPVSMVMLTGGITLLILGALLAWTPVLLIGLFSAMLFPVPLQFDLHRRKRDQL
jgi:hypothetical protein